MYEYAYLIIISITTEKFLWKRAIFRTKKVSSRHRYRTNINFGYCHVPTCSMTRKGSLNIPTKAHCVLTKSQRYFQNCCLLPASTIFVELFKCLRCTGGRGKRTEKEVARLTYAGPKNRSLAAITDKNMCWYERVKLSHGATELKKIYLTIDCYCKEFRIRLFRNISWTIRVLITMNSRRQHELDKKYSLTLLHQNSR